MTNYKYEFEGVPIDMTFKTEVNQDVLDLYKMRVESEVISAREQGEVVKAVVYDGSIHVMVSRAS